ncbi:hypothetical protein HMPREF9093_01153 [Fusobacterium sp. oral taxon 370 str. F0437]|nr:hypothetical protein HMPREF9093_01153 [Fusobacterium sp. oral taxon 370 str. F0437]
MDEKEQKIKNEQKGLSEINPFLYYTCYTNIFIEIIKIISYNIERNTF